MSSDEEKEETRSLSSTGRQKKPRAKTTITYKVGDSSASYGSITNARKGSNTIKVLGGGPRGMSTVSSDSDISTPHCHENVRVRDTESNKKARKTLIIASILCLFFMIVEIVGGYIAHSLAIMTDAAHLLSDFASFMISLISLFLASRPATRRMSYGWHRAEVIGAVVSVLTIWLLTGILVYVAIERIINKSYEVEAVPMVITASVGVCVNLIMGFVLHRGGHAHSHGGAPSRPPAGYTKLEGDDHADEGGHGHSHEGNTGHGHSHEGKSSSHGHSHDGGSTGHGHSHGKTPHTTSSTYQGGHAEAPIDHVFAKDEKEGTWIEIGNPSEPRAPDSSSLASNGLLNMKDEDEKKSWFKWPWKKGPKKDKDIKNINIRAALVHVIGDFFQSVGILIAALIIYFRPNLGIMDPICTFVFSILVLITTITVMRDALNVLMEGLPRGMSFNEVAVALQSLHGVMKVHDLRIWSLTMDKVALSVHLAVEEHANTQDVLREATQMLRERFRVYECTVQIEQYSNAMDECKSCENPKR